MCFVKLHFLNAACVVWMSIHCLNSAFWRLLKMMNYKSIELIIENCLLGPFIPWSLGGCNVVRSLDFGLLVTVYCCHSEDGERAQRKSIKSLGGCREAWGEVWVCVSPVFPASLWPTSCLFIKVKLRLCVTHGLHTDAQSHVLRLGHFPSDAFCTWGPAWYSSNIRPPHPSPNVIHCIFLWFLVHNLHIFVEFDTCSNSLISN